MVLKTITLKLHNPGKQKKEIIDRAMLNYSRAYQYLLDIAHAQIQSIRDNYKDKNGKYKASSLAKWVDKEISKQLNQFDVQPFKDSLKLDFGMMLASYLSLNEIQQEVNYPTAYISESECEEKYVKSLEQLTNGEVTLSEFDKEVKKVLKKNNVLKSLFFCRYDCNRDYCLLYDSENNRYYAKVYMMNVKDRGRKEVNAACRKTLSYIHKKGGELTDSGKRERFLIFPLSFGKWQEQYLIKAIQDPEMLKTARLIKKENEYYLSISVSIEEHKKIKTENYLGVSRSMESPVHYTVVDKENHILCSENIALQYKKKDGMGKLPVDELHKIANEIVETAYRKKSQVVVKSLIDKGDRLQWMKDTDKAVVPVLGCSSYKQLVRILDYKLPARGLPSPIRISPFGVFYTCPECGLNTKNNRFSQDMFICTVCGKTMNIDKLGSLNVACRLNCNSQQGLKIKVVKTPEGVRLVNKVLGLDYCIRNFHNDMEKFTKEIERIIEDFYKDIHANARNKEFKKKYSLIKKIQQTEDIKRIIRIV